MLICIIPLIAHKSTYISTIFSQSSLLTQNLNKTRSLLLFSLLSLIVISGVFTGVVVHAQTLPSSSSSLRYSKSTVVVNFDPKKGQLPEGLTLGSINNNNNSKDIFVSWAPIGKV